MSANARHHDPCAERHLRGDEAGELSVLEMPVDIGCELRDIVRLQQIVRGELRIDAFRELENTAPLLGNELFEERVDVLEQGFHDSFPRTARFHADDAEVARRRQHGRCALTSPHPARRRAE